MNPKTGLIHIYTGEGKGKTTASVGLAVRARGAGLRVIFAQFMKGVESSELAPLSALGVDVLLEKCSKKFVFAMDADEKSQYRTAQKALFSKVLNRSDRADLLILDEIISAVATDMIELQRVVEFLDSKPSGLEVVLTGRDPEADLVSRADYISAVQCRRHPYDQGITARKGIEF